MSEVEDLERVRNFIERTKRLSDKYQNRTLTSTECNNALHEISIINEQVEVFSIGFGDHFKSPIKAEMNSLISSIKTLSTNLSTNIQKQRPEADYY